jgi:Ala-tRNA(Pro) deacylase
MHAINPRLKSLLDEKTVPYEMIPHRRDYTAQETAADTKTVGEEFAKTVILLIDGRYGMMILPAHHKVDIGKVRMELNAHEVRLATEDEFRMLFPDCEVGAEPPFGNLYNMPVFLSTAIPAKGHMTFNAGTHEDVIRMRYVDYVMLVQPRIFDFSSPAGAARILFH